MYELQSLCMIYNNTEIIKIMIISQCVYMLLLQCLYTFHHTYVHIGELWTRVGEKYICCSLRRTGEFKQRKNTVNFQQASRFSIQHKLPEDEN